MTTSTQNSRTRQGIKADPAAPGTGVPAEGAVTIEQLKGMIAEAIKSNQPSIDTTGIVAQVVEAVKQREVAPTKDEIAAIVKANVDEAVKALKVQATAIDDHRRQPKKVNDLLDQAPRYQVEIPYSWSKGNLPVHGKQLLNILMKRPMNHGLSEEDVKRAQDLGDAVISRAYQTARGSKTLTSVGTNLGDELVPTDLSAELQRRLYLSSDLYANLAASEIDMPSQPYMFPLVTTRPTFYLNTTEGNAATASDPATASITLNAKRLMAKVLFSYELDEDSIVPILPFVQQQLAEAAAATWESVLINGDDSATHQDSDTHLIANAAEKALDGLRYFALAVAGLKKDLATGGLSASNLRTMLKAMGKYGIRKSDMLFVVGPNGQNDLLGLTEVLTIDKIGPKATLLTGAIGSLYGVPIITSEANREDLNASGVYDNATTTKGSILLFNKSRFLLGRRRDFTVETDKDISTQLLAVVASFRRAFVPVETPSATVQSVVIGYNYTA